MGLTPVADLSSRSSPILLIRQFPYGLGSLLEWFTVLAERLNLLFNYKRYGKDADEQPDKERHWAK